MTGDAAMASETATLPDRSDFSGSGVAEGLELDVLAVKWQRVFDATVRFATRDCSKRR